MRKALEAPEAETKACATCRKTPDQNPSCGETCIRKLLDYLDRNANKFEIRQTNSEELGYGVYLKAGQASVAAGNMLGAYLGEVLPKGHDLANEDYVFTVCNQQAIIDARTYGNWTRFINHHCTYPNVVAEEIVVGRCYVIVFKSRTQILAGQELVAHYGDNYFEENQKCYCSRKRGNTAAGRPHKSLPMGGHAALAKKRYRDR
jgi:SET domain-containing protein